jgi:hypothetical protein
MNVNIDEINKYLIRIGWNARKLAIALNLDRAYVYKVLKKQANPGMKFINSFYKFCTSNKLDINTFIFFA